jgi:hypothetical protein
VTRTGLTGTAWRRCKELLCVLVGPEKVPTDLSPLDLSQVNNYYAVNNMREFQRRRLPCAEILSQGRPARQPLSVIFRFPEEISRKKLFFRDFEKEAILPLLYVQ